MGIRGELFSARYACDGRTYFFNVKQNRNGDVFLSIVESKPSEGESFDRRSIVVFGESMEGFLKTFQSALKFMDKTGNKVALPKIQPDGEEKPRERARPRGQDASKRVSGFRDEGRLAIRLKSDSRPRPESTPKALRPVSRASAKAEPR
ncbi:MAG TPA: DUF3276 family protein, partial [Rectinemataceae bacterium]